MDDPIVAQLLAYLPPDRAEALLTGKDLPATAAGTMLLSDISGFTPLTEAVMARYGPRRGGEEFTDRLNAVYDALIAEVERYDGSIVGFAGDAMTVWFAGDDGPRAITAGLQMQRAMAQFARVTLPDGETVSLGMKVAISSGVLRRFRVGDPAIQYFDVVAGDIMDRVASCEGAVARGEIIVDGATARRLAGQLTVAEWRPVASQGITDAAVVTGLAPEAPSRPRPPGALPPDATERLRPWLVPEVARRIVGGQNVFLTELRPASALFAHFSGIDFEHDPAAPQKLDAYIRWLQDIIVRLEGVLLQLTIGEKGNYFYAAWGAPIAHDDDTLRACTAALEIAHPPPEIAAFITNTHVGITLGTMRTGAYGNRQRRTYGVLGDDTNLAARLMAKAQPGEILVSARAAERPKAAFDFLPLPPVTVKGKKQPIPLFRLLGRKVSGSGSLTGALAASPMIGRQQERALVVGRLERARRRRGQVISIAAEAGMGKSRLVAEVVRAAATLQYTTYVGDCQVFAREASFSVWTPIWRAFFQIAPDARADAVLAQLETELARIDPDLKLRAPLLGPLLNLEFPDNELTRTFDPKVRRASLEGVIVECIRHRSRSTPLLFVLEECHWIDEPSRSLLTAVIQAIGRLAAAVILAHRPVRAGELIGANEAGLDYVTALELGDLAPVEARELIDLKLADVFRPAPVPSGLAERVAARAGGNPFFVEELANLLKSRVAERGAALSLDALDLPESLHSLILGRIDQLTKDAQVTLKVASVIGRHFRTATLFGVHPLDPVRATLPAQLREMQDRDVVLDEPLEGEEARLFKHVVIQEVAYESLPYALRATIHEAIGRHLEAHANGNVAPWLDLLAFHYDRSNDTDKRRHYLVAAGDAARTAYAVPLAISYYERALPLLTGAPRGDVLAHLGEVLEVAGRWNDAFTRYREAHALAESLGAPALRARTAGLIGDLHRKRGEFPAAETWLERARLENAERGDEAGVALMLHLEATLCAQTGNFARATELYQNALELRLRLGDDLAAAKTLNNLGIVSRGRGDVASALAFYERSLAIRRRLNDRREIANSLNNLGFVHRYRGEFDRARALLEESVQMNRTVGDRWATANALTSLAELALDTADAALAQRCLAESITINRELGDRRALAFLLEGSGRLSRLKDAHAQALLFFSAASVVRETIGAPLEPADATTLADWVEQTRRQLPTEEVARVEAAGRSLPLGEVLDQAVASFGAGAPS